MSALTPAGRRDDTARRGRSHDPAAAVLPSPLLGLLASRPSPTPNRPRSTAPSKASSKDATGAVLPGVTVTVTNVDTGAQRALTSGADGGYRALLLPLGTYTVRAEMQGFKAAERTGVTLSRRPDRRPQLHARGGRRARRSSR